VVVGEIAGGVEKKANSEPTWMTPDDRCKQTENEYNADDTTRLFPEVEQ